eukprot:68335_1
MMNSVSLFLALYVLFVITMSKDFTLSCNGAAALKFEPGDGSLKVTKLSGEWTKTLPRSKEESRAVPAPETVELLPGSIFVLLEGDSTKDLTFVGLQEEYALLSRGITTALSPSPKRWHFESDYLHSWVSKGGKSADGLLQAALTATKKLVFVDTGNVAFSYTPPSASEAHQQHYNMLEMEALEMAEKEFELAQELESYRQSLRKKPKSAKQHDRRYRAYSSLYGN